VWKLKEKETVVQLSKCLSVRDRVIYDSEPFVQQSSKSLLGKMAVFHATNTDFVMEYNSGKLLLLSGTCSCIHC
jgi:hypothetical protein